MLREFLSIRKHLSGTHLGLAVWGPWLSELRQPQSWYLGSFLSSGERDADTDSTVSGTGSVNEDMGLPCLLGRERSHRKGVRELSPKSEPTTLRSKGKAILARRICRCKDLEVRLNMV